jgi:hypothetical protein
MSSEPPRIFHTSEIFTSQAGSHERLSRLLRLAVNSLTPSATSILLPELS